MSHNSAPSPRTWLMTWNPNHWEWSSFQDDRMRFAKNQRVTVQWNTVSKKLKEGDTAYIMRLGEEPKGLVARGTVTSDPYEDDHYQKEKAQQGEKLLYVDITLTDLRATCWATLQSHTITESTTVNTALNKRQPPLIFDKTQNSRWILTGDWEETG